LEAVESGIVRRGLAVWADPPMESKPAGKELELRSSAAEITTGSKAQAVGASIKRMEKRERRAQSVRTILEQRADDEAGVEILTSGVED
jgi:hypothetical protein